MDINNATALVTGANRGLGREFARQLVERGATVYATARRPETIDIPGVKTLLLDITDPATAHAAADAAPDVDLVINNAGIATHQNLLTGDMDLIRSEIDTHFFGTLAVTRAFAPVLGKNGGGAIINVLSNLSFRAFPGAGAYAAAKAAEWMMTNSFRLELADQGTHVLGLHLAASDTDMMAGWDVPKTTPEFVIRTALDGLQVGRMEVLIDEFTRESKSLLSSPPEEMYADLVSSRRD